MNNSEALKKQNEIIARYKEVSPQMLLREQKRSEKEIAAAIGMLNLPANREEGFLRYAPQDFIVEEIEKNGDFVAVNDLQPTILEKKEEKHNTLFAHLIKIGLPTETALGRISQELKLPQNKIGFAGLKDAEAITAQLIAFPNTLLLPEDLQKLNSSQMFFTGFYFDKGTLTPGDLDKNIFTITIRSKNPINEKDVIEKLKNIKENGVLNYFHYQRFGGLRLIFHILGKLILLGKYEEAVKKFLCESNDYDIPLVTKIRTKAAENYGSWSKMEEIFQELPYTFFVELKFLSFLKDNPQDFIGVLNIVSDQTKLWVYAYASYLFNLLISEESQKEEGMDFEIPALLSDDMLDLKYYRKYLDNDGIKDFSALKQFPFIVLKRRMIETYIFPEIKDYKIIGKNFIICFGLRSGAYATTFLSNLFELTQGSPVPEWVDKTDFDPKEILGTGNLKELRKQFKENWKNKD